MFKLRKVILIIALLVLVPSITAYAVSVLTLTVPSTVNVILPPGMTMYSYSSGCTTTQVTSISFTAAQGGSQNLDECLKNTGGSQYYIIGTSFSTDLSTSVGTISVAYTDTNGNSLTAPITMAVGNEIVIGMQMSPSSTAPTGSTSFNIMITVYSTSTG
ncbi:MAG: hypothetical protein JRN52_13445 [Nitrososphaerota archaeon]|nr:hypothetical protein [Nitrososphaerota archaeon]